MSDELQEEYDFDYSKAKPNRFAAKLIRPLGFRPEGPSPTAQAADAEGIKAWVI